MLWSWCFNGNSTGSHAARGEVRNILIVHSINFCVFYILQVREDLPGVGYAEIVFCIGFLIVYLADELLHYCCGEAIRHSHSTVSEEQPINNHSHSHHHHHQHNSYGTIDIEKESQPSTSCDHQHRHDAEDDNVNAAICHTSHDEPCRQSLAGVIGMLTALSTHALLEGLAIGIQESTAKVMILFTAVISHKLVVGFCLGVELSADRNSKFRNHFLAISVFSLGSVLGIALGMGLVDMQTSDSLLLPILQGIAGGTLLYVTLCEVLPREKARWHQSQVNKLAGLAQLFAFTVGFAVMTILNMLIKD